MGEGNNDGDNGGESDDADWARDGSMVEEHEDSRRITLQEGAMVEVVEMGAIEAAATEVAALAINVEGGNG